MLNFDTNDCCKVSKYSKELKALSKYRDFCKMFYLGQDVDGENVYGGKNDEVRFKNVDDMVKVLDSVINILHEYEEKQDKEAQAMECKPEETKVNSQALDILARLQSEFPVYAKSIHAIETTPNTEKLEFWCMPPEYFEDPCPEVMKEDKTDSRDIPSLWREVAILADLIDDFDKFSKASLEKDDCGNVIISYSEPKKEDSGLVSSTYNLNHFLESLKLKMEEEK